MFQTGTVPGRTRVEGKAEERATAAPTAVAATAGARAATARREAAAARAAKGDTTAAITATVAAAPRKRECCGCGEAKVAERADCGCDGDEGVRQGGW